MYMYYYSTSAERREGDAKKAAEKTHIVHSFRESSSGKDEVLSASSIDCKTTVAVRQYQQRYNGNEGICANTLHFYNLANACSPQSVSRDSMRQYSGTKDDYNLANAS